MRIDLHTHSSVSDGTDSPAALLAAAADDRGALDAPEQLMPRPLVNGRRHDTAPIPRTRPGRAWGRD